MLARTLRRRDRRPAAARKSGQRLRWITRLVPHVGAGVAFDAFGGYDPILWGLVVVSAVASLALLPRGSAPRAPRHGVLQAIVSSTIPGSLEEGAPRTEHS